MSRKTARMAAVQMCFADLFGGESDEETLRDLVEFQGDEGDDSFILDTVQGVRRESENLDETISLHLKNWTMERISRVSHAALRVAVYEMSHGRDVPAGVVIKEAVQITQRLDEESEGRFVNGVLSGILRDMEPEAEAEQ